MEYVLNDGVTVPVIGLGTYKMPDDESTAEVVAFALKNGYSSVDCASYYANQSAVGRGIAASGRRRQEVFVTSKVWRDQMGYDNALRACETTLKELKTDYLDLYLLHWPTTGDENLDSWRALSRLKTEGCVRSIGVSNYEVTQLTYLIEKTGVVPSVNQIQYNPENSQPEIVNFCRENNILVEAWSPLARGRIFSDKTLENIAETHHKSVAQICLRWEIQNGVRPIPKSSDRQRILANHNIFDFTLTHEQMHTIDLLAEKI